MKRLQAVQVGPGSSSEEQVECRGIELPDPEPERARRCSEAHREPPDRRTSSPVAVEALWDGRGGA